MAHPQVQPLVIQDVHTGERVEMLRHRDGDGIWLELRVSLPPNREGPPVHIHFAEEEGGTVTAGVVSAEVDGVVSKVAAGGSMTFPKGVRHRWWNEDDEPLEMVAFARPVVDLDRYLQAVFDVISSSPPGRPNPIYMAHILHRHRHTQKPFIMPGPVQSVVLGIARLVGIMLGKYRGSDWPGSPERCPGAPLMEEGEAP